MYKQSVWMESTEYVSEAALVPAALPDYRNQLMPMSCAGMKAQEEL